MSTTNPVSTGNLELTVFAVADLLCAVENLRVREISAMRPMTRVHQAPPHVRGVVNLRGQIMTVIDLGVRFGLGPVPIERRTRILVVPSGAEDIGLLVDGVEDVMVADPSDLEPPPSNLGAVSGHFFRHILKGREELVGLVDLDRILTETA